MSSANSQHMKSMEREVRDSLEPYDARGCAAERGAEYLIQSGEVRKETSGPSDSPEGESWRGKEHIGEAGATRRRLRCRPARPARYDESWIA